MVFFTYAFGVVRGVRPEPLPFAGAHEASYRVVTRVLALVFSTLVNVYNTT